MQTTCDDGVGQNEPASHSDSAVEAMGNLVKSQPTEEEVIASLAAADGDGPYAVLRALLPNSPIRASRRVILAAMRAGDGRCLALAPEELRADRALVLAGIDALGVSGLPEVGLGKSTSRAPKCFGAARVLQSAAERLRGDREVCSEMCPRRRGFRRR